MLAARSTTLVQIQTTIHSSQRMNPADSGDAHEVDSFGSDVSTSVGWMELNFRVDIHVPSG